MMTLSRRDVTAALIAAPLLGACGGNTKVDPEWSTDMDRLETRRGGRIGVMALDLGTGQTLSHRADERFAMCSTFKWLLGAVILSRVESGLDTLSRDIIIQETDMVPYAPTTGPAIGFSLTIADLCAATIGNSDNPAANLLLKTIGGPEGFTRALRAMGDETTRLDRYEPELNLFVPGDPRDTSTPRAMTHMLKSLLFGDGLNAESQHVLRGWMFGATTGAGRLKAGLPDGWTLGHKTGTNRDRASNDVGFAVPPYGSPILLTSFTDGPDPMSSEADSVHAKFARTAIAALRA